MGTHLLNQGIPVQAVAVAVANGGLYQRLMGPDFILDRHKSKLSRLDSNFCAPRAQFLASHSVHTARG